MKDRQSDMQQSKQLTIKNNLSVARKNQYSAKFLDQVWHGYGETVDPTDQDSSPVEITYRFAQGILLFPEDSVYDCTVPFGPLLQTMQRGIFDKLRAILPSNVSFK